MAADLVAHAGDRHVLLEERHLGEVRVAERDLLVDHAVDPELPGPGVDARDDQGRVDPVELLVRDDERRDPLLVDRGAGRQGRGDGRGGEGDRLRAVVVMEQVRPVRANVAERIALLRPLEGAGGDF